jgi:hypothetical protein
MPYLLLIVDLDQIKELSNIGIWTLPHKKNRGFKKNNEKENKVKTSSIKFYGLRSLFFKERMFT